MGKYSAKRNSLYYTPSNVKHTSFERKLAQFKHDPIRYYDGENEEALNKLGKLGRKLV